MIMSDKLPGYVYILTNPSFREDWVKIGMTSRNVQKRVDELDNTSVPMPFEVYATMRTAKYAEAERLIHQFIGEFTNLRIRESREFFNVTPEKALDIFKKVAAVLDDAVIDEVHKRQMLGGTTEQEQDKTIAIANGKTRKDDEQRIWMLPYNRKFFDLERCLDEQGQVYWTQTYNFKAGDICYMYSASPDSAIKFRMKIVEDSLPFSDKMMVEQQYHPNPEDFKVIVERNKFALLKSLGSTTDPRLKLTLLLEHGLMGAPRGAINLTNMQELLVWIEKVMG